MNPAPLCPLSPLELSTVRRLGLGKSYEDIASTDRAKVGTVRSRMHLIRGKLNAATTAQAVILCFARGWLDGSEPERTKRKRPGPTPLSAVVVDAGDDDKDRAARWVERNVLGRLPARPDGEYSIAVYGVPVELAAA